MSQADEQTKRKAEGTRPDLETLDLDVQPVNVASSPQS